MPDEEAADGLSLGPLAEEPTTTDLLSDIKGAEHLDKQQHQQLTALLTDFADDIPDAADLPTYHLDTGQAQPVCRKPYRPALYWKKKIEDELQELHSNGIIRHSNSPWLSPIMAVPKKTGNVRICVDFRAINSLTLPDNYPLPRIDDLVATVSSATYLTTLDLSKGYHQVKLTQDTIQKNSLYCPLRQIQIPQITIWIVQCSCPFPTVHGCCSS